jgi:hypothetical protein
MLLLAAAVLVPACGEDGKRKPRGGPDPAPNKVTLFEEGFSGAFPGNAWTDPTSSGPGPSASIAAGEGNPAPSLLMTTSAGPAPMGAPLILYTDSTTSISGGPVTVSVDMQVPAAGDGSGAIAILDSTNTPIAAAEWHPTETFGGLTFMIADPVSPTPATVVVAPPPPGAAPHRLAFSVDAAGAAQWTLNGGAPALTGSGFPAGPYKVRLYLFVSSSTGPYASFHFDNVLATTP